MALSWLPLSLPRTAADRGYVKEKGGLALMEFFGWWSWLDISPATPHLISLETLAIWVLEAPNCF